MTTRSLNILLVAVIFAAWVLLYYVDPIRFSHPNAILRVLSDLDFLTGFALMLLQSAFALMFGGWFGIKLANIINQRLWLRQISLRSLRHGLWLPFLVYWPLLIWPPRERYLLEPFFWAYTGSVLAVTLSTCYNSLAIRSNVELQWVDGRRYVLRESVLQALFISMVSQRWISPVGWEWFNFQGLLGGPSAASAGFMASLVLFLVLIFVLNQIWKISFDHAAGLRSKSIINSIYSRKLDAILGPVLLVTGCLILWQLFSVIHFHYVISSPGEVLKSVSRLLISGGGIAPAESNLWGHIGISLFEIFIGLIGGGGAALIVCLAMSISNVLRTWLLSLLPMTYISPFFLSLFLMLYWGGAMAIWRTTLGVALLIFFPCAQVLWGLRDTPAVCRILLAAAEALPYAFIAMIFGESMNSVAGLGYFMVLARSYLRIADGLAAALITVALLVVLSLILRWTAKRLYFSPLLAVSNSVTQPALSR